MEVEVIRSSISHDLLPYHVTQDGALKARVADEGLAELVRDYLEKQGAAPLEFIPTTVNVAPW